MDRFIIQLFNLILQLTFQLFKWLTSQYLLTKGHVIFVFRKKPERCRLELAGKEARQLIDAMIYFRNRAAGEGLPAEDINELIIRLTQQGYHGYLGQGEV